MKSWDVVFLFCIGFFAVFASRWLAAVWQRSEDKKKRNKLQF